MDKQGWFPNRRPRLPGKLAFGVALALASTGCSSAMTNHSDESRGEAVGTPSPADRFSKRGLAWPLKFDAHDFGAFCYSVYGCKIRYSGYRKDVPDDTLYVSKEALGERYPNNMYAGWAGIINFPGPAIVDWKSKDGVAHHAEIDMDQIFKDRLIRHNLRRDEIPEDASITSPGIILEVDDRTINIYMRAHIPTKALQKPGNRYSDFRDDLIKVFSKTY